MPGLLFAAATGEALSEVSSALAEDVREPPGKRGEGSR